MIADRTAATLEQLVAEQLAMRVDAVSRRKRAVLVASSLAVISGCLSAYLLASSFPAAPVTTEPGRIGIVLSNDLRDSTVQVDAYFDASVEDATEFKLVVSAIPKSGAQEGPTSVGFVFCGGIRSGLQLEEANVGKVRAPDALIATTVESDSALGSRSECDYVAVTSDSWQVILFGKSKHPLAASAGGKIAYVIPGVTTPYFEEDMNGSTMHPIPRESVVRVSMAKVPGDLTVAASAPQVPADGQLSWSSTGAEGLNPPSAYWITGSLGERENAAQIAIFVAGILAGLAGAAVLWGIEALVGREPKTRRT